jgi:hypothetical protein
MLTRRVKQGFAEWYVLETQEESWDAFWEHTRQGSDIGRPRYGAPGPDSAPPACPPGRGQDQDPPCPRPGYRAGRHRDLSWRVGEQLGYARHVCVHT